MIAWFNRLLVGCPHGVVDTFYEPFAVSVDGIYVADIPKVLIERIWVITDEKKRVDDVKTEFFIHFAFEVERFQEIPLSPFGNFELHRPAKSMNMFGLPVPAWLQVTVKPVSYRRPQKPGYTFDGLERFAFTFADGQWHKPFSFLDHAQKSINATNETTADEVFL